MIIVDVCWFNDRYHNKKGWSNMEIFFAIKEQVAYIKVNSKFFGVLILVFAIIMFLVKHFA